MDAVSLLARYKCTISNRCVVAVLRVVVCHLRAAGFVKRKVKYNIILCCHNYSILSMTLIVALSVAFLVIVPP